MIRINYICSNCGRTLRLAEVKEFRDEKDMKFVPCPCYENIAIEAIPGDFNLATWGKCSECEDITPMQKEIRKLKAELILLKGKIKGHGCTKKN